MSSQNPLTTVLLEEGLRVAANVSLQSDPVRQERVIRGLAVNAVALRETNPVHKAGLVRPFAVCGSFTAAERHVRDWADVTCLGCFETGGENMNVDDYARLYSLTWDITRYPYSVGTARGKRYPSPNGDWPDEDLPGEPGWKPESTAPYATLAEAVRDAEAIPARRGLMVDVCYYNPARTAAPCVAYRIHCEPWRDGNGRDLASLSDIHVEES